MGLDGRTAIAIAGMAIATYLTRAGGLWLMARLPPSPRVEAWLRRVPGAILAAIVAPAASAAGVAGVVATLATMLVMARTGNLPVSMAAGVGLLLLLRAVG